MTSRPPMLLLLASLTFTLFAQDAPRADVLQIKPYTAEECSSCAEWNVPHEPFKVFGNTYYVGTDGLAAILVTSDKGHVLIDGALPESAPLILKNIRTLGFKPGDIRLILNTHPHFDHAGAIGILQRITGARVAASKSSAPVLENGRSDRDDPQYGHLLAFPAAKDVETFDNGATLTAGALKLNSYPTAGHTPGGTSWSWESCEGERCLRVVYADSLTPITDEVYLYSKDEAMLAGFEAGFKALEQMPCDILLTPHPAASSMWQRFGETTKPVVDPESCRAYAAKGREMLAKRLAQERGAATTR